MASLTWKLINVQQAASHLAREQTPPAHVGQAGYLAVRINAGPLGTYSLIGNADAQTPHCRMVGELDVPRGHMHRHCRRTSIYVTPPYPFHRGEN